MNRYHVAIFLLVISIYVNASETCPQKLLLEGNPFTGYEYSFDCNDAIKLNTGFSIDDGFKYAIESCSNNETITCFSASKAWFTSYSLTGIVGGILLGFPLGQAVVGGEVNKTMLYASIPFVCLSFMSYSFYINKIKLTVNLYNKI